jgi:hypothetical protein
MDNIKKREIALYLSNHKKHGGMIWRHDPDLYYKIKNEADKVDPVHSIIKNSNIHTLYHQTLSGGGKEDAFTKQLTEVGMTSTDYLHEAKLRAYQAGYDPSLLSFANDGVHKLQYKTPKGIRKFGAVGYRDFIIWKHLEEAGEVPDGFAETKRNTYHKSHERISQIHKLDRYSPNALSLVINW